MIFISGCHNSDKTLDEQLVKKKLDTCSALIESNLDSAQNFISELHKSLTKSTNLNQWTYLYSLQARVFEQKNNFDSALYYHNLALSIAKQLNDSNLIARKYIYLSSQYSLLGNKELQKQNLELSNRFFTRTTNRNLKFIYQTALGNYYSSLEQDDSAKLCFLSALKLAETEKDAVLAIMNLGNIYNQLEQIDSAKKYYSKLNAYYLKQNNHAKLFNLNNNIAMLFWESGPQDSIIFYLNAAEKIAKTYNMKKELTIVTKGYANFHEKKGNFAKGMNYLNDYIGLNDSILNQNLVEKIANVEKDYAVKFQRQENDKLKLEMRRKNTLRNAAIVVASLLLVLFLYQLRVYKQKKKILEKEIQISEQEIDELLKDREVKNLEGIIQGRESEQKRIGRDLHDRLGSMLSTVKLHFTAMDEKLDEFKAENKIQFDKASTLLDEAVQEVRKISHDLTSGILVKQGLVAAIQDIVVTIESTKQIKINFYKNGYSQQQNLEFEITLYRIVQELISNILKHAKASKIDLHLTLSENLLTLILEDNGIGFDIATTNGLGIGMANVRQRCESLGGEMNIDSSIGKGTTVILEFKLTQ